MEAHEHDIPALTFKHVHPEGEDRPSDTWACPVKGIVPLKLDLEVVTGPMAAVEASDPAWEDDPVNGMSPDRCMGVLTFVGADHDGQPQEATVSLMDNALIGLATGILQAVEATRPGFIQAVALTLLEEQQTDAALLVLGGLLARGDDEGDDE